MGGSGCGAINSVIHHLDDFLCVGPPSSNLCYILLATVKHIAERFGFPLAADKKEGPTSLIKFLGIVIDSQAMECCLPDDKLLALKEEVSLAFGKHKMQLRELQSLQCKLNFACRIMPMGRVFRRQLSAATARVRSPRHFVCLNRVHRADLRVWFFWKLSMVGPSGWRGRSVTSIWIFLQMPPPLVMEHFWGASGVQSASPPNGGRWVS